MHHQASSSQNKNMFVNFQLVFSSNTKWWLYIRRRLKKKYPDLPEFEVTYYSNGGPQKSKALGSEEEYRKFVQAFDEARRRNHGKEACL